MPEVYKWIKVAPIFSFFLDDIEYTKLLSSSPTPNSEFMRQPPDGAEKIKIIDES